MQGKEKYIKPSVELISFDETDIITTSLELPEIEIDYNPINEN